MIANKLPRPNPYDLRDYQRASIDAIYNHFEAHHDNPLVVIPTGGGKAPVLCTFIREAIEQWPDTRILQLVHVKELVGQNHETMMEVMPHLSATICSASLKQRDTSGQVIFASIQSIYKKGFDIGKIDLIIADECFTGDTLVSTPSGSKRIDQVRCGDVVYSQLGRGVVESTSCAPSFDIYEVELSNGKTIKCTGGHPFFTESGWAKAKDLERGSSLFSKEDMSTLWKRVPSLDEVQRGWDAEICHERGALEKARILLGEVCKEIEPDIIGRSGKEEDKPEVKRNTAQAYQAWRERALAGLAPPGPTSCPRGWMGGGSSDQDSRRSPERRVSELLQGGHREQGDEDSNRNRRGQPFITRKAGSGQEKDGKTDRVRVVRVSRLERESATPVYNLQVSGHPSYFAEGVAVHNCHLIPHKAEGMYRKLIADLMLANPYMKIIGFTATPYRESSGRLDQGDGRVFGRIAYEIGIADLIKMGYLSPLIHKGMQTQIDVSDVKTRAGEYLKKDLAIAVDQESITESAVDEIVEYGRDRKSWLAFGVSVAHAEHIRDAVRARGYSAEMITGQTPSGERDRLVEEFKDGKIRCLTNCDVLTTGFNAPAVDLLAVIRPTKSAGLWVQICGRGTRLAPQKSNCLVLDFGENSARHGPVDQIKGKAKALSQQGGDTPVKECPECHSLLLIATRECPDCGHAFPPPAPTFHGQSSDAPILSSQIKPKRLEVTDMQIRRHRKMGKPDSVRVIYQCGLKSYNDFLCLDHGGFASRKAVERLAMMGHDPMTVDQAMATLPDTEPPTAIWVKEVGRYPEITKVDYEAT